MMISVYPRMSIIPASVLLGGGVGMALFSSGPLGLWLGMEVNFLGAICFLAGVTVEEAESAMNYFMIQVVGSGFLLMGILMLLGHVFLFACEKFMVIGVMLKLGVFPFHFWVPAVIACLSWVGCFIVSVVQNLAPLWALGNIAVSDSVFAGLELCSCATGLVGCVGGLGILHFRVLAAYSSLVHLGFMVLLSLVDLNSFFVYVVLYGLINCGMMAGFYRLGYV